MYFFFCALTEILLAIFTEFMLKYLQQQTLTKGIAPVLEK